MSNEIGSGYTGGDYSQSDFWNGEEAAHNIAKVDSPNTNKNRVRADHFNDVAAELVAVQKRLGAGIRGAQNSLEERLDRGLNTYGDPGGIRHTIGFDDFDTCIKNNTTAAVAGEIHGEPGHTETRDFGEETHGFELASNTNLVFPKSYKLDLTKSGTKTAGYFGIWADGKSNILIDGGEIDGNAEDNGYFTEHDHGITLVDCENVIIKNMYIHNMAGDGIYINGCKNIVIQNCVIAVPTEQYSDPLIGRNPISIIDGENIFILNCVLSGGYPSSICIEPNPGIDETKVRNVYIMNNSISDSDGSGITVTHSQNDEDCTTTIEDIFIIGNKFKSIESSGIYAWVEATAGVATLKRLLIMNNTFDSCGCWHVPGDYTTSGTIAIRGNIADVLIQNNIVESSGANGIYHRAEDGNVKIQNNQILNADESGIFAYLGNLIIEENMIYAAGENGIVINPLLKNIEINRNTIYECQMHGIKIDALENAKACELIRIIGNKCYNNSQDEGETYSGIFMSFVDKSIVDDNFCYDDQDTPKQKYGLECINCDDLTFGKIDGLGNTEDLYRLKTITNLNVPNAKVIGTWTHHDVAANLTNQKMTLAGIADGKIVSPGKARVMIITVYATAAVTAGTITVRVVVDGEWSANAILSTENTQANYSIIGDPATTIKEGDLMHCEINSSSDMEPASSNDIVAMVWIV